jgi:hypothetical protein
MIPTTNETSPTLQRKPGICGRKAFLIAAVFAPMAWLSYKSFVPIPWHAEIRIPDPKEEVPLDRFHWMGVTNNRSIATVTTCFTRDTWITTELSSVEDGKITLIASKVTGRSSNRIGDPRLMTFPVTFALADAVLEEGPTTLMEMQGATRSMGNFGGVHQRFEPTESHTFAGTIEPSESRLLYIEGDRPFEADRGMTIDDFASANTKGRFLVVTIHFER